MKRVSEVQQNTTLSMDTTHTVWVLGGRSGPDLHLIFLLLDVWRLEREAEVENKKRGKHVGVP